MGKLFGTLTGRKRHNIKLKLTALKVHVYLQLHHWNELKSKGYITIQKIKNMVHYRQDMHTIPAYHYDKQI